MMLINRSEMFLGKTDQSQVDFVLYKRPFDELPPPSCETSHSDSCKTTN